MTNRGIRPVGGNLQDFPTCLALPVHNLEFTGKELLAGTAKRGKSLEAESALRTLDLSGGLPLGALFDWPLMGRPLSAESVGSAASVESLSWDTSKPYSKIGPNLQTLKSLQRNKYFLPPLSSVVVPLNK